MARFFRTDTVEAVQLTWDNWREVADLTGGRFQQGLTIDRGDNAIKNGRAFLMIPKGDRSGERRVEVGWWVVKEGDEWIGMPQEMFRSMYRPANSLTT